MILHSSFDRLRRFFRCYIDKKYYKKTTAFLKENKKTTLALLILAVFIDILFLNTSSDLVTFGILLLYGIFIKMFKLKSKLTFLLCLALLGIMYIYFLFTGTSVSTEKAAVWLILFMALGIFQQWKES